MRWRARSVDRYPRCMGPRRSPFLLGVLAALAACSSTNPELYLVYDRSPDDGLYRLIPAPIETLSDPVAGIGTIADLRAGGEMTVVLDTEATEESLLGALRISGDKTPHIEFAIDQEGVAVPWDFDSAMLLTLYHHLERAAVYFESVGMAHARVRKLPVYYNMNLTLDFLFLPIPLVSDNAAYVVTLDAFWIPPRLILDDVPLSANRGVIIHEYSHAVFNRVVYEDQRVPDFMTEAWPAQSVNELRSLDEGVADIFAAIAVGDPDFIGKSVSEELFGVDRDLREPRIYDAGVAVSVILGDISSYDPYVVGSIVASALWALRGELTDAQIGAAVFATLEKIVAPDASFRLTDFFNALLPELPPSALDPACDLFVERLEAVAGALTCF